jgi:hypothetical protein
MTKVWIVAAVRVDASVASSRRSRESSAPATPKKAIAGPATSITVLWCVATSKIAATVATNGTAQAVGSVDALRGWPSDSAARAAETSENSAPIAAPIATMTARIQ